MPVKRRNLLAFSRYALQSKRKREAYFWDKAGEWHGINRVATLILTFGMLPDHFIINYYYRGVTLCMCFQEYYQSIQSRYSCDLLGYAVHTYFRWKLLCTHAPRHSHIRHK